ncbi:MAG: hydroxyethylthiazole kinase [Lachnospiraceae bacterium]|nr:hydroxyethylthiazole kinase [Lachnospiraceae bacterium]
MFSQRVENVRKNSSLVHCITNYVTVNDCANVVLACGASPIMADDPSEAAQITSNCQSLVLNMGTLNKRRLEAMILAGKQANKFSHPVILDPVGAGASSMRREALKQLSKEVRFSVIKGNISEMRALFAANIRPGKGVDAREADIVTEANLTDQIAYAARLSSMTGAVIIVTGALDLVVSEKQAYVIYNGHPMMARITGSGCMLGALLGAFAGSNKEAPLEAAAAAVAMTGICGERAGKKVEIEQKGTGSFRTYFIDEVSLITGNDVEQEKKIKRYEYKDSWRIEDEG